MHLKKTNKRILLVVMMVLMVFAMVFVSGPEISYADEDPETVSVYLSMSDDDHYLVGPKSGDVMALKHYDVPYFDLGQYDLSYLDLGKGHTTMLHLYIWATEISYCGLDPSEAGKGYLYDHGLLGTEVFDINGTSGSSFLNFIWGLDFNLNYYWNYEYPLAGPGWGATSDQIELSDGDIVTLGHFTNFSFYSDPRSIFNSIGLEDSYIHATTIVTKGDTADLVLYRHGAGGNYTTAHIPIDYSPDVYIAKYEDITSNPSDGTWTNIGAADADGHISVDTTDLDVGEYLVALPGQLGEYNTEEICSTPGAIRLEVKSPWELRDDLVNLDLKSFVYDGHEQKPEVTVTASNGKVLVEGKDYTVKYSDNVKAGVNTGEVTVKGIGKYFGEVTKTFTIEPKELTTYITGTISKTYDGKAGVETGDFQIDIDGVVEYESAANVEADNTRVKMDRRAKKDDVQIHAKTITYDDANVGKNKTITASGLTLTGADKDNYKLASDTITTTGDILPKEITASLSDDISKTYDGTADVEEDDAKINLNGIFEGDDVKAEAKITYEDAKVGNNKKVTASDIVLVGADKDNYKLITDSLTSKGNILRKELVLSISGDVSKTYDGKIDVEEGDAELKVEGIVGKDDVKVTDPLFTYDNAKAGENKTIYAFGFYIKGADKGNYSLPQDPVTTKGKILQKELILSIDGDVSKTYDGTIDVEEGDAKLKVDGIVGKDDVKVTDPLFTYDNAKVGTDKMVTASGFDLDGTDKNNYKLPKDPVTTTGKILQKELVLSIDGDVSKIYDGTIDVEEGDAKLKVDGIVGKDDVKVTDPLFTYDNAKAGKEKIVYALGFDLDGADKSNYSLPKDPVTTTGEILKKELVLSIDGDVSKTYDGTNDVEEGDAKLKVDGIVGKDDIKVVSPLFTYDNAKAGKDKTVTVSGCELAGADKNNYKLPKDPVTTVGEILPKELTASIVGDISKTYDGTIDAEEGDAELQVNGIVGKDDVKVTDSLFTYDNAKVGTNKTVYALGYDIEGADKSNYRLPKDPVTTIGEILPKELKVSITGDISKTYDGTSNLEEGDAQINIDGVVEDDEVKVTGATFSYEDAKAGTDKIVIATGFTLEGSDKDNYKLVSDTVSTKGEILPKELTVSINGDISKIYDGTDDVEKGDVDIKLDGILDDDNVKLSFKSIKYEDAAVGNDKIVTVSGLTLKGADKDNYKLASDTMTTTGDIQKKPTIQVDYDANGGSGTMAPVEVEKGSKYTLPDNGFTPPEGKVFKAWQVNDSEMKPGESLELSENTSIKALWQDEVVPAEAGETDQTEETEVVPVSEETNTSDNNMPYIWLTLMALSACGILFVNINKVKQEDN